MRREDIESCGKVSTHEREVGEFEENDICEAVPIIRARENRSIKKG